MEYPANIFKKQFTKTDYNVIPAGAKQLFKAKAFSIFKTQNGITVSH
jgi:hypothetical protein